MKKLFMLVALVFVLVVGVSAGVGFMAGKNTTTENVEKSTVPTDEDLVRLLVIEEHGEGEYEIVITEDQGDGYIDYFVFDEEGNSVMNGWVHRDVMLKEWYETH